MAMAKNPSEMGERLYNIVCKYDYCSDSFLNQFGPNVGDSVVVFVAAAKKTWYWKHTSEGWKLQFAPRGYTKNRGERVRPFDIRVRVNKDGTIDTGDAVQELTPVPTHELRKKVKKV